MSTETSSSNVVVRLQQAINKHDLDALASCFAANYVNETPVHPARSFVGRDQVRRNWAQIFAAVPDLKADLLGWTRDGDTVWAEWEMGGTRVDGHRHLMRGINVMTEKDEVIASTRFYFEPVEESGEGIDATIRAALGR